MPKQSKVATKGSKPNQATPIREEPDFYYCSRCERKFRKQRGNFPASQSPLFTANNRYLPICNHCIDELYEHYKNALGSDEEAVKRLCMKFDIYWSQELYDMTLKSVHSNTKIRCYIGKSNLAKFHSKTYDDTLDEEKESAKNIITSDNIETIEDDEEIQIDPEIVKFWGYGYSPDFYQQLQDRYEFWTEGKEELDTSEISLYRQICLTEATISVESAAGRPFDKYTNTLNNLLGSANLKPSQKKAEETQESSIGNLPFGMGIKQLENTRPVPKPDPEFEDVDGIVKYISIWFLGHFCKMTKVKNFYSKLYEKKMNELRVEKPEYKGDDDETLFNDIFGGD